MEENNPPKLARRKENRKSTMKSGRTIGEKRERLETASERLALHKKLKVKKNLRIIFTTVGFLIALALIIFLLAPFFKKGDDSPVSETIIVPYSPTIEIIDEDAPGTDSITSRMKEYIGQAEADFRELGYIPVKAVIPTGAIREVDFYLEGYTGFIKMIIDRGTGVSVEDADRMLRYLAKNGISKEGFQYIDVRIDGKAYWK